MNITVEAIDDATFNVVVEDGRGRSRHKVTVDDAYHHKLTGGEISKQELLEKSFRFLLERESKESILSSFDLPLINRYFPEYERVITT